jgi:cruciform cutting endonuclease 1
MATSRLFSLRSADLSTLLSSIGSRSSGTKVVMIDQLLHDSKLPKLAFSSLSSLTPKSTTRVLSIDMGIKNLAFCVCDVPAQETETPQKKKASTKSAPGTESTLELSIVAWKRIAVTGSSTPIGRKKKVTAKDAKAVKRKEPPQIEKDDPFSPMSLSKTAYKLVREVLLPYAPDTILIERQRFRSGGGSAVQEWTVRVNMFESMIWAVLTTLKNEGITEKNKASLGTPQIWDVSPMRVASFWIGDAAKKAANANNTGEAKKKGRTKVEKKEKVDLVQRWISPDNVGQEVKDLVNISFEDDAARTRDAFMASRNGTNRKAVAPKKVKEPKLKKGAKTVAVPVIELPEPPGEAAKETLQEKPLLDIGKLDDLADCLLQAGAWTKWEKNRRVLHEMIKEDDVDGIEEWVRDKD